MDSTVRLSLKAVIHACVLAARSLVVDAADAAACALTFCLYMLLRLQQQTYAEYSKTRLQSCRLQQGALAREHNLSASNKTAGVALQAVVLQPSTITAAADSFNPLSMDI
eukprot:7237-Heterococcus_DN1.PRE.2